MSPRILPANKVYRCVNDELATITTVRIRERFATLLTTGPQAAELPAGVLAAGQYLDQPDYHQRGLFGTAAALLVHAVGNTDDAAIKIMQGLVEYLRVRPSVEAALAGTDRERSDVLRKIEIELIDTFKTADLIYALSFVPSVVSGKEAYLRGLVDRVCAAQIPAGGWGTQLAPDTPFDAFATAHILRALRAVGMPIDPAVPRRLAYALQETADPYTRTFFLTVLLDVDSHVHAATVRAEFKRVVAELREQLGTLSEANFEYTIGNRQYYVRVPWQLYLIQVAVALPSGIAFFSSTWQKVLLRVVELVNSADGFVYPQSGRAQSTRTYGIVCDLLRRIIERCRSVSWFSVVGAGVNRVTRAAHSPVARGLVLVAGLGVVAWTVTRWLVDENADWRELAPNFIAAGVIAVVQVVLVRARR